MASGLRSSILASSGLIRGMAVTACLYARFRLRGDIGWLKPHLWLEASEQPCHIAASAQIVTGLACEAYPQQTEAVSDSPHFAIAVNCGCIQTSILSSVSDLRKEPEL